MLTQEQRKVCGTESMSKADLLNLLIIVKYSSLNTLKFICQHKCEQVMTLSDLLLQASLNQIMSFDLIQLKE